MSLHDDVPGRNNDDDPERKVMNRRKSQGRKRKYPAMYK
jgi:hypothetical protein